MLSVPYCDLWQFRQRDIVLITRITLDRLWKSFNFIVERFFGWVFPVDGWLLWWAFPVDGIINAAHGICCETGSCDGRQRDLVHAV